MTYIAHWSELFLKPILVSVLFEPITLFEIFPSLGLFLFEITPLASCHFEPNVGLAWIRADRRRTRSQCNLYLHQQEVLLAFRHARPDYVESIFFLFSFSTPSGDGNSVFSSLGPGGNVSNPFLFRQESVASSGADRLCGSWSVGFIHCISPSQHTSLPVMLLAGRVDNEHFSFMYFSLNAIYLRCRHISSRRALLRITSRDWFFLKPRG